MPCRVFFTQLVEEIGFAATNESINADKNRLGGAAAAHICWHHSVAGGPAAERVSIFSVGLTY